MVTRPNCGGVLPQAGLFQCGLTLPTALEAHHLLHDAFALLGDFTLFTGAIRTVFTHLSAFTPLFDRYKFGHVVTTGFTSCHGAKHSSPFATFECPRKAQKISPLRRNPSAVDHRS